VSRSARWPRRRQYPRHHTLGEATLPALERRQADGRTRPLSTMTTTPRSSGPPTLDYWHLGLPPDFPDTYRLRLRPLEGVRDTWTSPAGVPSTCGGARPGARRGRCPQAPDRAQLARDLKISQSCLRNWLAADEVEAGERPGLTKAEREELVRLRRENRVLRMERDLLSRAAAFFAPRRTSCRPGSDGLLAPTPKPGSSRPPQRPLPPNTPAGPSVSGSPRWPPRLHGDGR
jgi:transposase